MDFSLHLSPAVSICLIVALAAIVLAWLAGGSADSAAEPEVLDPADPAPLNFPRIAP